MKKAVLIFGTFNPITAAHVDLGILSASKIPDADIYYIPSNIEFMKKWKNVEDILTDKERVDLVRKTVKPHGFFVCDAEVMGVVDGKTYNTILYLKEEYKYDEIYICCGYDKLEELHLWYRATKLVKENQFLIFSRNGLGLKDCECPFVLAHKSHFLEMDGKQSNQYISSTKVRQAFLGGRLEEVKEYVPKTVYDYLKKKGRK